MPYDPYGSSGSIAYAHKVRSSKPWKGSRSKRFGDIVVRDKDGHIIATIESSPAVKLAKKLGVKPSKAITTPKPLTDSELRAIALDERRQQFAKSLNNIHALAN